MICVYMTGLCIHSKAKGQASIELRTLLLLPLLLELVVVREPRAGHGHQPEARPGHRLFNAYKLDSVVRSSIMPCGTLRYLAPRTKRRTTFGPFRGGTGRGPPAPLPAPVAPAPDDGGGPVVPAGGGACGCVGVGFEDRGRRGAAARPLLLPLGEGTTRRASARCRMGERARRCIRLCLLMGWID